MTRIHRIKKLPESLPLFPDREFCFLAAGIACISNGKSLISDIPNFGIYTDLYQFLSTLGYECSFSSEGLKIEGKGLNHKISPLEPLTFPIVSDLATSFWIAFLALKTEIPLFLKSPLFSQNYIESLHWLKKSQCHFRLSAENTLEIHPLNTFKPLPEIQWTQSQAELRNLFILNALFSQTDLQIKEPIALQEHLLPMLIDSGVDILIQKGDPDHLDEIQKRLAKLKGIKPEKFHLFKLTPALKLNAHTYKLPKDQALSAFFAVLASLIPSQEILLQNICQNTSRNGFFTGIRKLGAIAEFKNKRENSGETLGDFSVKTAKELVGKKLSGDSLLGAPNELPLLTILASFAEGESIIKNFSLYFRNHFSECLAENLKKSSVEIGVFEDGLVLRGRKECDGAEFTSLPHPELSLSIFALALLSHGQSEFKIENAPAQFSSLQDWFEYFFPHLFTSLEII